MPSQDSFPSHRAVGVASPASLREGRLARAVVVESGVRSGMIFVLHLLGPFGPVPLRDNRVYHVEEIARFAGLYKPSTGSYVTGVCESSGVAAAEIRSESGWLVCRKVHYDTQLAGVQQKDSGSEQGANLDEPATFRPATSGLELAKASTCCELPRDEEVVTVGVGKSPTYIDFGFAHGNDTECFFVPFILVL